MDQYLKKFPRPNKIKNTAKWCKHHENSVHNANV